MYCGKCGTPIGENSEFCSACGGKISRTAKASEAMDQNEVKKNKMVGAIAVGMVAVVLIVVLVGVLNKSSVFGYKSTLKKYFEALETSDASLYYSIMAEDYIKDMISGWRYTEEELKEEYQDFLEDQMEEYVSACGENINLTYEVTDTYQPDQDEIKSLNSWLEDYGFSDGVIADAIVAKCNYTVKGREGSADFYTERLLMKVRGKWRITGGYINLSWYEQ